MVLVLAALVAGPVHAAGPAEKPSVTHALPPDAGPPPPLRRPDAARLEELRGQRAFQYIEPVDRPEQSAWDAFWARVWRNITDWLNSRSYSHFWRWIFYALFLVAGIFVVLKLVQVDLTAMLSRTPRRISLAYDAAAENIHEVDFTARLAEAEAAGNWRLAVRLGYLQLLKTLSDHGLIRWQPDKTNHAYLAELPAATTLRADFRTITQQFEYVWYGELAMSRPLYERVRAEQRAFHNQASGATRHAA
jgi:hypothetical protein